MDAWGYELEVDVVVLHVFFEEAGGFVVKFLEDRFESAADEELMSFGVGSQEFFFTARGEGLGEYGVGIVVVDDHDVFVASAGRDGETAGLVAVDLAG